MSDHHMKSIANSLGISEQEFVEHMDTNYRNHTVFSPSGSHLWFNCSGGLIPNLLAKDTAGADAAEGTVAHAIAENWLKTGVRPDHLVGTIEVVEEGGQRFEIEITYSMLDHVQEYVDRCLYLPGDHYVETRVDFSDLTPLANQSGTADHAACEMGKLTVTDLKFGKGVQVFAENNTQAILYAYGFFKRLDWFYDFRIINIRIAQPRLGHFDEWEITSEQLLEWAERIKERAFAAWCPGAPRTPGTKQCQFCKIKTDCTAYVAFAQRAVEGVFDNLDCEITTDDMAALSERLSSDEFVLSPVTVGSLTTAQKARLLPYRKMVEQLFTELSDDLERRALDGEVIPGYKVVEGRSDRVLIEEEKVVDHLSSLGVAEEKLFVRKMVGIGKIEDELRAAGFKRKQLPELLEPIVRKPPGKPTMVPEHDKRPALALGSTFDNLDEL